MSRTPPRIYGKDPGDFNELEARVEALHLQINRGYWELRDRNVPVLDAVAVIAARYDLTPVRAASILGLAPSFVEKHYKTSEVASA